MAARPPAVRTLDTNIVIQALNARPQSILERLSQFNPDTVVLSAVVVHELRYGADRSARPAENHARLDRVLLDFRIISFDPDDAAAAARIRAGLATRGTPTGPFDVLIAGQALARDLILVTNNRREFDRVPGLWVEVWSTS